ncbi:MAG: GGDEF domain-containing protein [Acidimicrobiia bacterium]|nr:GGDEF domain-containing protein [Acidimicrobiia bacterium]
MARGIEAPRWLVLSLACLAAAGLFAVDSAIGSDAHVLLGAFVIVVAMTWAGRTYEATAAGMAILVVWAALDLVTGGSSSTRVLLGVVSAAILLGIGISLTQTFRRLVLEMDEATRRDSLTGLLNTKALQVIAEQARQRAAESGEPISIAFLDLDGFKQINDLHGHVVGDNVLTVFGEVINSSVRATDIVGRVGGDEFTLILPNTDLFEAVAVLQRIRHRIALRTEIPLVTATTGYVTFTTPPDSVEEMIHIADDLMYKGKRPEAGGGRMIGRVVDGHGRLLDVSPPQTIDITDAALDESRPTNRRPNPAPNGDRRTPSYSRRSRS